MKNKILKQLLGSWTLLMTQIQERKPSTPFELVDKLLEWIFNEKEKYSDDVLSDLYNIYILDYTFLDKNDYFFDELWYDFNYLLEYDLIKTTPDSIGRVFEILDFVLNEIFTFRTTIECPHSNHEFRAHMDQDFNLYLYSEQCNYYKDHDESTLIGKKLIPASYDVVKKNGLSSYSPR